jgi:hypothetical protein
MLKNPGIGYGIGEEEDESEILGILEQEALRFAGEKGYWGCLFEILFGEYDNLCMILLCYKVFKY